jgi:DNA-binding transcriptional ArsR family regulator
MEVILMTDTNLISLYPDNTAQREQIERQAGKQDETLSEYCLKATKQRMARELQDQEDDLVVTSAVDQRTDSYTLSVLFEALATDVREEIATVVDVDTRPELVYTIALWELLAKEYSSDQRASALAAAPDILEQRVTELRQNGGEER